MNWKASRINLSWNWARRVTWFNNSDLDLAHSLFLIQKLLHRARKLSVIRLWSLNGSTRGEEKLIKVISLYQTGTSTIITLRGSEPLKKLNKSLLAWWVNRLMKSSTSQASCRFNLRRWTTISSLKNSRCAIRLRREWLREMILRAPKRFHEQNKRLSSMSALQKQQLRAKLRSRMRMMMILISHTHWTNKTTRRTINKNS